jgi:hypothetical protein
VADFSPRANPGGPWSYFDSALLTHTHTRYKGVQGFPNWSDDVPYPDRITIGRNRTGQPVVLFGGDLVIPTDHLMIDDEESGVLAIVQFTAPTAGTYTLKGDFKALAANGPGHGVAIDVNNEHGIFGKFISHGNVRKFDLTVTLAVGDTLQFEVGRGKPVRPTQTGLKLKIVGP